MKKVVLWVLAFLLTLALALYQRLTGPTHPKRVKIAGKTYKLPRSGTSGRPACIKLPLEGKILYRHHKTTEPWKEVKITRMDHGARGCLPTQPPAGKLDYEVILKINGKEVPITKNLVTIRFKGKVPPLVLILHILVIFSAMLLATRAFLAAVSGEKVKVYVLWTFYLFLAGAFVLGPLVQKYAFGVFWSGFPFGIDLTDNKSLIALLAWLYPYIQALKGKVTRKSVAVAWGIMLLVFLIPHSLLGSELKYTNPSQG